MIYKKLLEIQQRGLSVTKNKTNPHYKNGYPDINEVLSKVLPVLSKKKISLVQSPTTEGLLTTLIDTEDDTKVESLIPWTNNTDPQKIGGAITYYRRYSLVSLLNLEAEDDDGNQASQQSDVRKEVDDLDI